MSRNRWCLIALAALTPLSIQVHTQGDTLATVTTEDGTRFEVLAGAGEYAFITRGCEGQIINELPASFRDAGARVEHDFGNGLSLGLRGGVVHDDIASSTLSGGVAPTPPSTTVVAERAVFDNSYVNPYFTYAQQGGSVGLGWVWHERDFITAGENARTQHDHPMNDISAHLRIGPERRYFAVRWMEGVPISSSGGYLQMGIGGQPDGKPITLFAGMGAGGPYEGAGLMLQGGYQFRNGITTSVRSRIGFSGKQNASGISVGAGYGVFTP